MSHIHELYDYTVAAFIVYDGKVLLVEHPRYGKWLPPGGHIELDEDPDTALFREIREETGLEVEILTTRPSARTPGTKFLLTPNRLQVHEANLPHKHIGLIYYARAQSDKHVLSAEHTQAKWLTPEELHDETYRLDDDIIFCAHEAWATAQRWSEGQTSGS